jgi:Xaa-Pro aminopeptidase
MGDRDAREADRARLRSGRLDRLQNAMSHYGVEVCLLLNEPNIRYATGASAMPVYAMSTFVRCALVPQSGRPILFEHSNSIHRSVLSTDAEVRPMRAWEFYDDAESEARIWAEEIAAAVRELGVVRGELAVDRLGTPGFLSLQQAGFRLRDSSPVTQEAREVKTPEEVALMRRNGRIIVDMLESCESAITPGVRERELLASLSSTMLRQGGEYLATSTVCSGPNTNPWRAEATDRAVEAGDLVYVDTDTVGIEGYFFCVSRTFLCGDVPALAQQRDAYRAAFEWLMETTALVRPGITCAQLAREAPAIPDRYLPQRYECLIHGVGLEEESPSVCHPLDRQSNGDRHLQENMTLVVEIYAGEVGGTHGVKLGDEILVTADAPEVLAPYPFAANLL